MNMEKYALLLQRVSEKLEDNRQGIFQRVSQQNPEDVDSAFNNAMTNFIWENHQRYPEMYQAEMESIVTALSLRERQGLPFGPIEQAALDYVALVAGCEGPMEHTLYATCYFELPSLTYDGSVDQLRQRLRVGMGVDKEALPHAKLEEVQVLALNVEPLEGGGSGLAKCQVNGRMQFKLTVLQPESGLPPLENLLAVILADNDRVGPTHRIAVDTLHVFRHDIQ
jgi:hypothetical protein